MALPSKVNIGTAPGNGTGDPARTAFDKLNNRDEYLENNKLEKGSYTGDAAALKSELDGKETPSGAQAKADAAEAAAVQTAQDYTDSFLQGLKWKNAVEVATTANITLSGEQTIDGITTSTSRVLVKDQTDPTENGIYLTDAAAWTRATDADAGSEIVAATVKVKQGTDNANTIWSNNNDSITLGTTNITFADLGGGTDHNSTTGIQGGQAGEYFHLTQAQIDKLNGTEANATGDMSAAEIKTAYESNSNTNAFTDANLVKLNSVPDNIEPAFTKNSGFNKPFGTTANTVAEGNDQRILNGQTAFGYGDHSQAGYALDSQVVKTVTVNGTTYQRDVNGDVDLGTIQGGTVPTATNETATWNTGDPTTFTVTDSAKIIDVYLNGNRVKDSLVTKPSATQIQLDASLFDGVTKTQYLTFRGSTETASIDGALATGLIKFDNVIGKVYGDTTPLTGNISIDEAGAKIKSEAIINHNDSVEPAISTNGSSQIKKVDGYTYTPDVLNVITLSKVGSKIWAVCFQEDGTAQPSNTAPTDITLSSNAVNEDAANDTVVGTLSTTDAEGGAMTYSILSQQVAGAFKIVGNELQVADTNQIVYANNTTLTVTIQATDNGGLTYNEQFTINVNEAAASTEFVSYEQLQGGVTAAGSGTLNQNGSAGAYANGAFATKAFNADNSVTWDTPEMGTNTNQGVGITNTYGGISTDNIDMDIFIVCRMDINKIGVYEDGAEVFSDTSGTAYSELKLEAIETATPGEYEVKLYRDGNLLYTSGKTFTMPLTPIALMNNSFSGNSIVNLEFQNSANLTTSPL